MMKTWRPARWLAASVLAFGLMSSAGAAMANSSSATINANVPPNQPIFVDLPQYSGPGTITGVTLSLSGTVGGVNYYPYLMDQGITVPSGPASWDVDLQGPDLALIALAPINTEFVGGSIPPCGDPICDGAVNYAYYGPTTASFSISGSAMDLSDFAGSGTAEILVFDSSEYDNNAIDATLTETITTSAGPSPMPEPSAWGLMIAGLGGVGGVLRRRRMAPACRCHPGG